MLNRRHFLMSGAGAFAAAASAAAHRPNVLLITADDMNWNSPGVFGNRMRDITPNIDRLASEGLRFQRAHVTAAVCQPSRSVLMTGRYPFRTGMQSAVIPSNGNYGLDTDERTLPQALKEAGYYTAMVGKWHIGHADPKFWPRQRGFDYHYGAVLGELD